MFSEEEILAFREIYRRMPDVALSDFLTDEQIATITETAYVRFESV